MNEISQLEHGTVITRKFEKTGWGKGGGGLQGDKKPSRVSTSWFLTTLSSNPRSILYKTERNKNKIRK